MFVCKLKVVVCAFIFSSSAVARNFPNDLYGPRYRPLWKKGTKNEFTKRFGPSSIIDLVEGSGFMYENHTVQTEDGYLLNLNRMVHPDKMGMPDKGYPLLLLQGLGFHSDAWFMQQRLDSNTAPVWGALGYDVWMGDQRGTIRSRKHSNFTVNDKEIWNYTIDEVGLYDSAAFIDYVLEKTGRKNLVLVCVSLGCSYHAILVSERPAYNEKILGALYFMPLVNNMRKDTDVPLGHWVGFTLLNSMIGAAVDYGINDFIPKPVKLKKELFYLCRRIPGIMNLLFRFQFTEAFHISPQTLCSVLSLSLGGANTKSVRHMEQMYSAGELAKYDFGRARNLERYGREKPPMYDVSKITSFVALYYSDADGYSSVENVKKMLKSFGGPTYECLIPNVSHFDFVAGTTFKYVLPDVNEVLDSLTGYNQDNQAKAMSKECPSFKELRRWNK